MKATKKQAEPVVEPITVAEVKQPVVETSPVIDRREVLKALTESFQLNDFTASFMTGLVDKLNSGTEEPLSQKQKKVLEGLVLKCRHNATIVEIYRRFMSIRSKWGMHVKGANFPQYSEERWKALGNEFIEYSAEHGDYFCTKILETLISKHYLEASEKQLEILKAEYDHRLLWAVGTQYPLVYEFIVEVLSGNFLSFD